MKQWEWVNLLCKKAEIGRVDAINIASSLMDRGEGLTKAKIATKAKAIETVKQYNNYHNNHQQVEI